MEASAWKSQNTSPTASIGQSQSKASPDPGARKEVPALESSTHGRTHGHGGALAATSADIYVVTLPKQSSFCLLSCYESTDKLINYSLVLVLGQFVVLALNMSKCFPNINLFRAAFEYHCYFSASRTSREKVQSRLINIKV